MSWVWTHPEHADDLRRQGLTNAADFLCLPGVILGGHPDRHVRRVELMREVGPPLTGYLKREHRVRLRDRLASVWAGLGWTSRSTREARVLQEAAKAGIGCPKVLAFGEGAGQAFVLVENLDMADLRKYAKAFPRRRRMVARALGREIARLHTAGFQHPELYAKHVLIRQDKEGCRFAFLDWQLAAAQRRLTVNQRCRDLAALHATLADELASPEDRMAFLRAYRRAAGVEMPEIPEMARLVDNLARGLLGKRRIRELRQMPLPQLSQNLIWIDGEKLCVTLEFWKETNGQVPPWLRMPASPRVWPHVEERRVAQGTRTLTLTRRWFVPPAAWSLPGLKRTTFPAPEFEQVAALIRLQRFGVRGPRLLAVGHQDLPEEGKYSFLLLEPFEDARPLEEVPADPDWTASFFPQLGRFLRRLHEAGYALKQTPFGPVMHWGLMEDWDEEGELVLMRLDGVERSDLPFPERLSQDLGFVLEAAATRPSAAALDILVRAYMGRSRRTAEFTALQAALTEALNRERQVV